MIDRAVYYGQMRRLALEKRAEYELTTPEVRLARVRQIYKREGIQIDPCNGRLRKLKAAYFNDENGCSVYLNMKLPKEPRLFAMIHELKHHFVDCHLLRCVCSEVYDTSPVIEIAAEVFAAEFIFPEDEFREYVNGFGMTGTITPEDVVHLQYHSPAQVSYQFLQKRLEWIGAITKGQFSGVQFYKLHEQMYGSRHYRKRRT